MFTLERYLDGIEVSLAGSAPTLAVSYEGEINQQAMARAFEFLCTRHPVLLGRIRHDELGYLLYVRTDHYPQFDVFDGDEHRLQRECRRPWDCEHGVARLMLIRGEGRGFVALRMDHSTVDGHAWIALFDELWRLYSDVVSGSEIAMETGESLPTPPTSLLEKRWGGGEQTAPRHDIRRDALRSRTDASELQRVIRMNEEDTARLVAAARAEQVSVHALICGAVLVSLRARFMSSDTKPMLCLSVVDLRDHVNPPVGSTETTNLVSVHIAEVSVPASANTILVGREIKRQLNYAIVNRELSLVSELPRMLPSWLATTSEPHLALVAITNGGVISPLAHPSGLTITDLEIFQYESRVGANPGIRVYTYGGRLKIQCCYPGDYFTNYDVEDIVDRLRDELRQISKVAGEMSVTSDTDLK